MPPNVKDVTPENPPEAGWVCIRTADCVELWHRDSGERFVVSEEACPWETYRYEDEDGAFKTWWSCRADSSRYILEDLCELVQESSPEAPSVSEDAASAEAAMVVKCLCGLPAISFVVKKEGPTKGRQFFSCPKRRDEQCDFFQWLLEGPAPAVESKATPGPEHAEELCQCGLRVATYVSRKEGPNCGRSFTRCPKRQGEQCEHFAWVDLPPPAEGDCDGAGAQAETCLCGLQVVVWECKQGPNTGRSFTRCPKRMDQRCSHFKWQTAGAAPEAAQASEEAVPVVGGGPAAAAVCPHTETTRKGSNASVSILKCKACGEVLERRPVLS